MEDEKAVRRRLEQRIEQQRAANHGMHRALDEMRAEAERLRKQYEDVLHEHASRGLRINSLERDCAVLRAAVDAECSMRVAATDAAYDLQTRLAAAEALLLRVDDALEDEGPWLVLQAHIRAFLADSAILPVPATDGGRKRS